MDAAASVGEVVVFPESLYSYGPVTGEMTEATPSTATAGKLGVRAELIRARAAHTADTVSMVASDFYGPRVRAALAGKLMVPRLLAGKSVQTLGRLDQVHSFTYVPDLAAAMIAAADQPQAWNRVLHAPTGPALTQRDLVRTFAEVAGVPVPRIFAVPTGLLRAVGVVSGQAREAAETGYMTDRPFVMTSTVTEELLGLRPTPLREGIAATIDYWRTSAATPHPPHLSPSPEVGEELSQVGHQEVGCLQRGKVPAAVELGPPHQVVLPLGDPADRAVTGEHRTRGGYTGGGQRGAPLVALGVEPHRRPDRAGEVHQAEVGQERIHVQGVGDPVVGGGGGEVGGVRG